MLIEVRQKNDDANLVYVWVVASVDSAVHPLPAQTKKYNHQDCAELPLGNRSSDARQLRDFPPGREILGAANSRMADISRRRFRAGRGLSRIDRHSSPGQAISNNGCDKRRPSACYIGAVPDRPASHLRIHVRDVRHERVPVGKASLVADRHCALPCRDRGPDSRGRYSPAGPFWSGF